MLGVSIEWAKKRTAICYQVKDTWTWPEFDELLDQAFAIAEFTSNKVDVIFQIQSDPASAPDALDERLAEIMPKNCGKIVLAGPATTALVPTLRKFYPEFAKRFVAVKAIPDAFLVLTNKKANAKRALAAVGTIFS